MTIEALLARLDAVRPRGPGRWSARCPGPMHANGDRHPSLSIAEGEKGLLLKCWAACTPVEIVSALGLALKDLFYDGTQESRQRAVRAPRPRPFDWRRRSSDLLHQAEALDLRAERTTEAAKGVSITHWTDSEFDASLDAVADAYRDRARAELLRDVACSLRVTGLAREKERSHAA